VFVAVNQNQTHLSAANVVGSANPSQQNLKHDQELHFLLLNVKKLSSSIHLIFWPIKQQFDCHV
jgi:hypothetical protein